MKRWTGLLFMLVPVILAGQGEKEKNWKTELGLSYVNTSGNTKTETYSSKLDVAGKAHGNRYLLKSQLVYAKTGGTESANRVGTDIRAERVFTGRLFGFLGVTHVMDKFSGYDHRASVGPGLGLDIINQDHQTLKGMLSSMFYYDDFAVRGMSPEKYPTAKAGLNYTRQIKEHVSFKGDGDFLMSLEETEKHFITTDLSLQIAVQSNLAIGIGYQIHYQNAPPAEEIKKTDTTFLTSLVVNW